MASEGFIWEPGEQIVRDSNLQAFLTKHGVADFAALSRRATDEPDWFWNAVIDHHDIQFTKPYDQVLDLNEGIAWPRWCVGGETNLAMNCLERNLELGRGNKLAIVWEGEDGTVRRLTYAELAEETAKFSEGLRELGLGKGDIIALYMPMVPEVAAAFFAIARIGAIVLPLFSGFGAS